MLAINFMESSQGPAGPIQLSTFPLDSISVLDAVTFTIMLNILPIRTKVRLKNPKVSKLATILLPCKRISHQDFTSQATNTSPTVSYSRESSNQVPRSLCCLKAVLHFCYFLPPLLWTTLCLVMEWGASSLITVNLCWSSDCSCSPAKGRFVQLWWKTCIPCNSGAKGEKWS